MMVWTPTLQDIEADAAELVHVGVEDLSEEADLGRRHGVVVGEEELELEDAACSSVCQLSAAPAHTRKPGWSRTFVGRL
jgi:hypothetical protein